MQRIVTPQGSKAWYITWHYPADSAARRAQVGPTSCPGRAYSCPGRAYCRHYVGHFTFWISPFAQRKHSVYSQAARSKLLDFRRKKCCRKVDFQTSDGDSLMKVSRLDGCKLIRLHHSFLLKYNNNNNNNNNNNKYLRTIVYSFSLRVVSILRSEKTKPKGEMSHEVC